MADNKQIEIETKDAEIIDQQEFQYKYFKLDVSKLTSLINKELSNTSEGSALLQQYKKEDIIKYIQSPISSQKILRQISNLLYNLSPQYKRLLHYIADMARYDFIINLNSLKFLEMSKEEVMKKYLKMCKTIENMSIKHEFNKITKNILVEDTFFGYTHETESSFTIQRLNPDFCRVCGWADGVRRFQFDFNYFNNTKNKELLDTYYAPEFKERFETYKNSNDKNLRWQELSLEYSICIKMNEILDYSIPFFASIFPDIFDLQDYKLLKKAKEELQNFVILVAKIPYLKESGVANNFSLLMDDAINFSNKAMQQLPDQCGYILSPFEEITDIHLGTKDQVNNNSVADAEASFWNASGTNMALFNSDKITEESVRRSIQVDENMVFSLYRQYERWLNRKIKLCYSQDFSAKILETTQFNCGEVFKRLKEAATVGEPSKREMSAVLGKTPLETEMSIYLENKILDYTNKFEPLISSNTMSPDKVNGRPAQKAEGSDGTTGKKQVEED